MADVPDLDYSAIFAALSDAERTAVRTWERLWKIPPGAWPGVPSLRMIVVSAAMERVAGDIADAKPMSELKARVQAAQALGPPGTVGHSEAERVGRRIRGWRDGAEDFSAHRQDGGTSVNEGHDKGDPT